MPAGRLHIVPDWYTLGTVSESEARMEFEYDPAKSAANLKKHGIDFEDVQAVWDDPDMAEVVVAHDPEMRYAVMGRAWGSLWTVIVTYRGEEGETVRVISARKATKKEADIYAGR